MTERLYLVTQTCLNCFETFEEHIGRVMNGSSIPICSECKKIRKPIKRGDYHDNTDD